MSVPRAIAACAVVLAGCDLGALELYDGGAFAPAADVELAGDVEVVHDDAAIDGGVDEDLGIIDQDQGVPPTASPQPVSVEALDPFSTVSTTFVDVPGAILEWTPNATDEPWIIFASGLIASDSAADDAYEVALSVDDNDVDRFNHKATGGSENWGGFLTFYPLSGDVALHTAKLRVRANIGSASVSSVRLVAAPLPAGADFHQVANEAEKLASGVDQAIAALDFTPSSDGAYYVLARAEQSAQGPADAVSTTFEGSHPFANASKAAQPIFFAQRSDLSATPQSFAMRGTSSGNAPVATWWNTDYHRALPVTITAGNSFVPSDYALPISFDHQTMVASGESAMNGADIRVIYDDGVLASRVRFGLDPDSTWGLPNTTIWILLPASIRANAADGNYRIYYANNAAPGPIDDIYDVFLFYDDFTDSSIDGTQWNDVNGPSIDQAIESVVLTDNERIESLFNYPTATVLEARLTAPANVDSSGVLIGLSDTAAPGGEYAGFQVTADLLSAVVDSSGEHSEVAIPPVDVGLPHTYSIVRDDASQQVIFSVDGLSSDVLGPPVPSIDLFPFVRSDASLEISVDWLRLHPWLASSPAVDVGAPLAYESSAPSRWRGVRIIAFRADAFDRDFHSEAFDPQTSNAPVARVRNSVTTAMSGHERAHLILQHARLSGEASATLRKDGVLSIDGEVKIETSHKIDADGSIFGYHHTAGFAGVLTTRTPFTLENAYRSPDGISVEIADSVIAVLRYHE